MPVGRACDLVQPEVPNWFISLPQAFVLACFPLKNHQVLPSLKVGAQVILGLVLLALGWGRHGLGWAGGMAWSHWVRST